MPTKTKSQKWEQLSPLLVNPLLLVAPPPNVQWNSGFIISDVERLAIVKKYFPKLSKTKKNKAADGIEIAVREFLLANNFDKRPQMSSVRVQMKDLETAASVLLNQLRECDDFSRQAITMKAASTPPPSPEQKPRTEDNVPSALILDRIEPMDPPDRLIDQLQQYTELFGKLAKAAAAKKTNRKKTAFPTLVRELLSVWKTAKGQNGAVDPELVNFIEEVANNQSVRKIVPPVGDQRRKIQRAIKE